MDGIDLVVVEATVFLKDFWGDFGSSRSFLVGLELGGDCWDGFRFSGRLWAGFESVGVFWEWFGVW